MVPTQELLRVLSVQPADACSPSLGLSRGRLRSDHLLRFCKRSEAIPKRVVQTKSGGEVEVFISRMREVSSTKAEALAVWLLRSMPWTASSVRTATRSGSRRRINSSGLRKHSSLTPVCTVTDWESIPFTSALMVSSLVAASQTAQIDRSPSPNENFLQVNERAGVKAFATSTLRQMPGC